MLLQFSTRRVLSLMLLDTLGSIGLVYLAGVVRAQFSVPAGLGAVLTSAGVRVSPLTDLTLGYLVPKATVVGVAVIWPMFLFVFGVYDASRSDTRIRELRNVTAAVSVAFVTLAGVLFFVAGGSSRLVLLMFFVIDLATLLAARAALYAHRSYGRARSSRVRQSVLIIGAGEIGRRVSEEFTRYACADLSIVGFVDDDPAKQGAAFEGVPVLGTTAHALAIAHDRYIDHAVIALPLHMHARIVELCTMLQNASVRVHVVPDLFALTFPRAALLGFGGVPVIDLGWTGISGWRLFWKRTFDLAVASIAFALTAPIMLVIAIAIRLDSPGPIIYRQRRVGRNHRPFNMLKFRSMIVNADPAVHSQYVARLIKENSAIEASSGRATLKMTGDPRITRVGRILRKTSLDELPQLVNVLVGEMSLVGPRPPTDYEVALYSDWHRRRFEAPPGITGLWQVRGRNAVSFDEMVRMDLEYIEKQSVWLDVRILFQTPIAVVHGRGAG